MDSEANNEQESLDKDEQTVSRLIAGLKHVEAPANFERRVMAEIAEGRPHRRSMFAIPVIVYAVPALVVLIMAVFFVFRFRQPSTQTGSVAVVDTITQPQNTPSVNSNQTPEPQNIAQGQPEPSQSFPADFQRRTSRQNRNANTNRGGGSYDEAMPNKKQPMPEGIDPNSRSEANRGEVMTSTDIPVTELLEMLGISVETKDQWRVVRIRANGAAERSGVKAGDVITAFNDRDVSTITGFKNFGSIATITVRRDGKLIPLRIVTR